MSQKSHLMLATHPVTDEWVERLQSRVPGLRIEQYPGAKVADIPAELWQETDIMLTFNTLPALEQAPHLRWVQLYSAGANHVLNSPLLEQNVQFTTASGVHSVNIAEYVFTMVLGWYHRLDRLLIWQQTREWPRGRGQLYVRGQQVAVHASAEAFFPRELRGMTIGILGYGSIGREVARIAKAFGMRVLAIQRGSDHRDHGFPFPDIGDPEGTLPDQYYAPEQLFTLLGESDIVVVALPLTRQTEKLINEDALRAMKSDAFLVNIARGSICDEAALIRALKDGEISGAALDVFEQEPLPSDSALYDLPNVFLSPHVSGATPMYAERVMQIFEANLQCYLRGEPPRYNLVDHERGY
jgi:phosphoglycerate dehydrogenase-like enzyme